MTRFRKLASICLLTLSCGSLQAGPVNINQATAEEIAANLTGIGEIKARAIVQWRNTNGPFDSADRLSEIKGIGPKTVEANRQDIKLSD